MRCMHYAKTVPDAELNTKERSFVKDFMNVKQNLTACIIDPKGKVIHNL